MTHNYVTINNIVEICVMVFGSFCTKLNAIVLLVVKPVVVNRADLGDIG